MTKIALALGGNVGDVPGTFDFAVTELRNGGVLNIIRSGNYISSPIDCKPGTADFVNAALIGDWNGSALELLDLCQKIEISSGRERNHGFHEPRTLDIDIVIFGAEIIDVPGLKIPHREAQKRLFVLEPLAAIAPEMVFGDTHKTVTQAYEDLRNPRVLKTGEKWAFGAGMVVLCLSLAGRNLFLCVVLALSALVIFFFVGRGKKTT